MNTASKKLRYAFAPTPLRPVCNSTAFYYRPNVSAAQTCSALAVSSARLALLSPRCIAALYVIIANGMRSAEYLSAVVADVLPRDRLLIHGRKGSADYLIQLPGLTAQAAPFAGSLPGIGVAGVRYIALYRSCLIAGIGRVLDGHKNIARTHAGRYNLCEELLTCGSRTLSDVLHHRSSCSVNYYTDAIGGSHG